MRRYLLLGLLIALLPLLLWLEGGPRPAPEGGSGTISVAAPVVRAAPNAFSGPVGGGCYAQTTSQCRIHIDAWAPISVTVGEALLGFQLRANGQLLYDFRTDSSNPPVSGYTTARVAQDYAVQCGGTYSLTLWVEDSGSGGLQVVGETTAFSCPLLETPTATPTSTPTLTATPVNTPLPFETFTPPPEKAFLPHLEQ